MARLQTQPLHRTRDPAAPMHQEFSTYHFKNGCFESSLLISNLDGSCKFAKNNAWTVSRLLTRLICLDSCTLSHFAMKWSRIKAMNKLTDITTDTTHHITKYNWDASLTRLEYASRNTPQLFTTMTSQRTTKDDAKSLKLFAQYCNCS